MITYILELSLYWALLYGFYVLALKQETFFGLNRIYLLVAMVMGIALPLVPAIQVSTPVPLATYWMPEISLQTVALTTESQANTWSFGQILTVIYAAGVTWMFIRLMSSLWQIRQRLHQGKNTIVRGIQIVITPEPQTPFSFLNTLVLSENDWDNPGKRRAILIHEAEHIRQRHSLDVLLLAVLQVFFWWHPLFYLFKNSIREIHEFQADSRVTDHYSVQDYGRILIEYASNRPALALSHSFIQSQLKQRFMMMAKNPSTQSNKFKYSLIIPMLSLVFFLVNCQQGQAQMDREVYKVVEIMPAFPGCSDKEGVERQTCSNQKMMAFVMQELEYPESAAKNKEEGTVMVQFIITEEGELKHAKVMRAVSESLDAEALRIVKAMNFKPWSPGMQRGKAVNTEMILPVKFKLTSDEKE